MMWKPTHRKAPPSLEEAEVDVFITTYNEPVELVRLTVEAAMRIRWEQKRVYILDDGNRLEFKTLAEYAGCEIITRGADWQGKPRHAKAGNVNNALLQTSGEYILILDADQIPHPEILEKTLGYFRDEKVAFVQPPQHFYNPPPGDHFGSDAPLFYGPILQGKDGWNAAFFCGSNAVLRREALLQLGIIEYAAAMTRRAEKVLKNMRAGLRRYKAASEEEKAFVETVLKEVRESEVLLKQGFSLAEIYTGIKKAVDKTGWPAAHPGEALPGIPEQLWLTMDITRAEEAIPLLPLSTLSMTEDMATSIRLHSLGWKSVFHKEILAYGLAPEDLGTALAQRLRWAQGTIQVLVKENPLTVKGLSLGQRLQYFTTIYSYFSGFAGLIFLLFPIIYLSTGIAPVRVYSGEFLWRLLPFLAVNRIMFRYISRGLKVRRGEQYTISLFPLWIKAVLGVLFGRKPAFVVTPKQRQTGNFLPLVKTQILMVVLSVAAMVYCLLTRTTFTDCDILGISINMFWALYNSFSLMIILRAAVYTPPKGWESRPPEDILPRNGKEKGV